MDSVDVVRFLAGSSAGKARPKRREELDETLPYFQIGRDADKKRLAVTEVGNYQKHDNADRMGIVTKYLDDHVLPYVDREADLNDAFFNVELHDSYSYLAAPASKYDGVFTFAKRADDVGPVLLPDPYQMTAYGGLLRDFTDSLPTESKTAKIIFAGTTTGDTDPSRNARIKLCLWSLQNRDILDAAITKIAQMTPDDVQNAIGAEAFAAICLPRLLTLPEQQRYRYHLMASGNTCRFDVWPLASKSIVMMMRGPDVLWWHPLLRDGREFLAVPDQDRIRPVFDAAQALGEGGRAAIVANANAFVSGMLKPTMHNAYTVSLLESIAANR
jgi:hypothetical protein